MGEVRRKAEQERREEAVEQQRMSHFPSLASHPQSAPVHYPTGFPQSSSNQIAGPGRSCAMCLQPAVYSLRPGANCFGNLLRASRYLWACVGRSRLFLLSNIWLHFQAVPHEDTAKSILESLEWLAGRETPTERDQVFEAAFSDDEDLHQMSLSNSPEQKQNATPIPAETLETKELEPAAASSHSGRHSSSHRLPSGCLILELYLRHFHLLAGQQCFDDRSEH